MSSPFAHLASKTVGVGRGLQGDGRGTILVAISVGWIFHHGILRIYPVMLPYLRGAYEFDLTVAGLLLTVLSLALAVGQLPAGVVSDRIGTGTAMAGSMFLAGVAIAAIIAIPSAMSVLVVATAIIGFAAALYGIARFTALSDLFPEQVGTVIGVTSAAGDLGNTVLPLVAGVLASVVLWQVGFGFTIPLFVAVGVYTWVVVPRRTADRRSPDQSTFSLARTRVVLSGLHSREIIYGTVILTLSFSIYQAFTGFYPTYLIEAKGLSGTVASTLFGLLFGMGLFVRMIVGVAYDRIGVRRSMLLIVVVSGLALVVLPFTYGFWPLAIVTVLASTHLGTGTVLLSYLTDALPSDIQGTGLGVLRTCYMLVAALSPVYFGAAADMGYFDEAFLAMAAITGVVLLLVVRMPEL